MEGTANSFKYTGAVYYADTGLYCLRAQYYDPSIDRFLNEDTYEGQIDNPLSLNLYTYVGNNPLRYTDPSGNRAWLIHGTFSDPSTWENDFLNYIGNVFNEGEKYAIIEWNGGNSTKDRKEAAEEWVDWIYKWHSSEENKNEPIRLIGHSHGGEHLSQLQHQFENIN